MFLCDKFSTAQVSQGIDKYQRTMSTLKLAAKIYFALLVEEFILRSSKIKYSS